MIRKKPAPHLMRGWAPVFPRDKREAFARRSCSNNRGLRHRRRDELLESRPAGELSEPALEMRQRRFGDAFDSEPAPCIGAERNIGDREVIALDEAPRCQLRVDNAPLD